MIEVLNRERRLLALLQNASGITETLTLNGLDQFTFSLPYDDAKNEHCKPFNLVRWQDRLYRIVPAALQISDTGLITYTCEHVIARLIDKTMFGSFTYGGKGVNTRQVLNWILSRQSDWRLGDCAFSFQFEYGWEQETLLSALLSVPANFVEPYIWVYDTKTYPWTVHLRKIDLNVAPQLYIRNEKNILELTRQNDPAQLCTRLYPLGYGEGVNQLHIRDVNGGLPYLQSPASIVARYGIIERVWIDRQYEDAESLKQAGLAMLTKLQEPMEQYSVSFAELDGGYFDSAEPGKIVRILDKRVGLDRTSYITSITRNYEDITQSTLTISNTPFDVAQAVADIAGRQRIETAYAQGATQLYSQACQANADKKSGAVIDFYIPAEMRIVNEVVMKIRMEQFRAYAKTATSEGGRGTQTSRSGGGAATTSGMAGSRKTLYETSIPSTWQKDDDSKHVHNFWMEPHDHKFTIPSHTHTVELPGHTHAVSAGIFRYGSPKSFGIYVGGQLKKTVNASGTEIDITPYLLGSSGLIPRGQWLSVELRPDDLAYFTATLIVQGFVQSRGDRTV